MIENDLYFLSKDGDVWAHWLSGKPPVKLADASEFAAAFDVYRKRFGGTESERACANAGSTTDSGNASRKFAMERAEERYSLTVIGKLFAVGGSREITILDLSERGCRFRDATGKLVPDDRVSVKIGPIGPVEAIVRWRSDPLVGIEFASALYPSVMEHIRANHDLRTA